MVTDATAEATTGNLTQIISHQISIAYSGDFLASSLVSSLVLGMNIYLKIYQMVQLWFRQPKMPHTRKAENPVTGQSVHKGGCLYSPTLLLEIRWIPGQMLVLSLCWNSKEVGFNTSCSNNIDVLLARVKVSRQREKQFPFSIWITFRKCDT